MHIVWGYCLLTAVHRDSASQWSSPYLAIGLENFSPHSTDPLCFLYLCPSYFPSMVSSLINTSHLQTGRMLSTVALLLLPCLFLAFWQRRSEHLYSVQGTPAPPRCWQSQEWHRVAAKDKYFRRIPRPQISPLWAGCLGSECEPSQRIRCWPSGRTPGGSSGPLLCHYPCFQMEDLERAFLDP